MMANDQFTDQMEATIYLAKQANQLATKHGHRYYKIVRYVLTTDFGKFGFLSPEDFSDAEIVTASSDRLKLKIACYDTYVENALDAVLYTGWLASSPLKIQINTQRYSPQVPK